jgi:hypothetical protein
MVVEASIGNWKRATVLAAGVLGLPLVVVVSTSA